MSSETAPRLSSPPQTEAASAPDRYEILIENRLGQTRRHVKWVDVTDGAITLAIGVLLYLMLAAVIDQWLVTGGLGRWERLGLWAGLWLGAGFYSWRRLLPPLVHRVNPIFAAATIEKSEPSLKNSLINFLLLRAERRQVAPVVYREIEHRAASDLSRVSVDTAVDRTRIVRLFCVLAAAVAVFSLYLVLSAKNPLRSAARVLWPWSAIEVPTRVSIRDVQPGDTAAFNGQWLVVSAEVTGLKDGEPVSLIYSTADRESVDQVVPLTRFNGEYRHQCRFPPDKLGLQQDCEYCLVAGDARTRPFQIRVQTAPAIAIDRVDYHYPAYTGMADQSVAQQGDLRAIEGTSVTLYATANTDIKPNSAQIDLDCTGRVGIEMTVAGRSATGHLVLRLNPDDPSQPEHKSYQLRFSDPQGQENRSPSRHTIQVIRDGPPDVRIVEPAQAEVRVAVNGRMPVRVCAEDDFGLRGVTLWIQQVGKSPQRLLAQSLLERKAPQPALAGPFQGEGNFEPARMGLKAGDRVQYWAEAEDNKEPEPGRAATTHQVMVVVGPEPGGPTANNASRGAGGQSKQGPQGKNRQSGQHPGEKGGQSPAQPQPQGAADTQSSPSTNQADSPNASQPSGENQPPKDKQENKNNRGNKNRQGDKEAKSADSSQSPDQQPASDKSGQGNQRPQPGEKGSVGKSEGNPSQQAGKQGDQTQPGNPQGGQEGAGQEQDGHGQSGQPSGGGSQQSQASKQPNERVDPEDSASAVQEILNDRQEQKRQPQSAKGESGGTQQDNPQQADNRPQAGNEASRKEPSAQPAAKSQSGMEGSGSRPSDGHPSGGQKSNTQPSSGQPTAQPPAGGEKSTGQQTAAAASKAAEPSDERLSGAKPKEGTAGSAKPSQGKPNEGKPNEGNRSQAKPEAAGDHEKSPANMGNDQPTGAEQAANKPPAAEANGGEKSAAQKAQAAPGNSGKPEPRGNKASDTESPKSQPANQTPAGEASNVKKSGGERTAGPGSPAAQPSASGNSQLGPRAPENQAKPAEKPADGGATGRPSGAKQDQVAAGQQKNAPAESKADAGSEKVASSHAPSKQPESPTAGQKKELSGNQSASDQSSGENGASASGKSGEAVKTGQNASGKPGQQGGEPGGGRPSGEQAGGQVSPESNPAADQTNLDYTRKQTELALEYLRDQLAKEKPHVLKRLGWTKDDAARFLKRWQEMQRAAAQQGAEGAAARRRLDDALRSLGLRPHGTQIGRGGTAADQQQNLRSAGRYAPPHAWAEQLREYLRGVGGDHAATGQPQ